ncbi:MAG: hypothetical protein U7123_03660 [Potamolinea sp.]
MTTNLIETMYGLGYRLKAAPEDSPSPKESQAEVEKSRRAKNSICGY